MLARPEDMAGPWRLAEHARRFASRATRRKINGARAAQGVRSAKRDARTRFLHTPTGMQAHAAVAAGGVTKKRAARSAAQGTRGGIRDGIRPPFATTRGLNEH